MKVITLIHACLCNFIWILLRIYKGAIKLPQQNQDNWCRSNKLRTSREGNQAVIQNAAAEEHMAKDNLCCGILQLIYARRNWKPIIW